MVCFVPRKWRHHRWPHYCNKWFFGNKTASLGGSRTRFFTIIFGIFPKVECPTSRYFENSQSLGILISQRLGNIPIFGKFQFPTIRRNFHIFSITYLTGGSFRVWRVEWKKRNHARWGPRKLSILIIFLCFRDPSISLPLRNPLCCDKFPKIFPQKPRPRPAY